MTNRQLFQHFLAQTSENPVGIEIASASGNYLNDADGRRYLDLIGGISVCNIGHRHPAVVDAIKKQADEYLHVMVYGEVIQSPQVQYASMLTQHLPGRLNNVYFTNSGAEATEGALKLARRYTHRTGIIACNKSYHGNTMGALSVMGDASWRNPFGPLLPGVSHYDYNSEELIHAVNDQTACVIIEAIQGEAGVVAADINWIQQLRERCTHMGALLIIDEIQCGFGRTGHMWGFDNYRVPPDILLLGKALGGGMPLGAFVSSSEIMRSLTHDPVLGHITTFGGHPVCCAAGMAAMQVLVNGHLTDYVADKGKLFLELLQHPAIKEVRGKGLLIAVELESAEHVTQTLQRCLEMGVFSDWFLFAPECIRIAPPLTITENEIRLACSTILSCLS